MTAVEEGDRNRLDEGWDALRVGRWQAARAYFSDAVESNGIPEAFEGLSWAAWWLDDAEALFEAREQAFRLYRERGDAASAARMATWLASDQLDFYGALAVASGWVDRAQRLLAPLSRGPDHGWLAFHRGFIANIKGDVDAAEADGGLAATLGQRVRCARSGDARSRPAGGHAGLARQGPRWHAMSRRSIRHRAGGRSDDSDFERLDVLLSRHGVHAGSRLRACVRVV